MKFDDLYNKYQLIIFIKSVESHGYVFTIGAYGNLAIKHNISTSTNGLSNMLSSLKNKGLLENEDYCWTLTQAGCKLADYLADGLEDVPMFFKYDEQPNNFQDDDINDMNGMNDIMKSAFESMAKSFDSMNKSFSHMADAYSNMKPKPNIHDIVDNGETVVSTTMDCLGDVINRIKAGNISNNEVVSKLENIYSNGLADIKDKFQTMSELTA